MIHPFILSVILSTAACQRDSFTASDNIDNQNTSGDVTLYVTSNNRAYDLTKLHLDYSNKFNMSPNTIHINTDVKYQSMEGFGAAITGSTCYNLMQMSKEDRTKFLTETFSENNGFGMSYVRISIGCSDFFFT